jgi:hypothetical protein
MLNKEGILKVPTVEELTVLILQTVIKEYNSNSQSLLNYFKKRTSEEKK